MSILIDVFLAKQLAPEFETEVFDKIRLIAAFDLDSSVGVVLL